MDCYERLANAIILRAVQDYRLTDDKYRIHELEKFFQSVWFGVLTSLDGTALLQKLRKEKYQ